MVILQEKERSVAFFMNRNDVKTEQMTEKERLKYEIAEELGLLERVQKNGWKSLSAKETGRIGGIMTRRMRKEGKQ